MLLIGASHVGHFGSYISKASTPERFSNPFENTFFLSMGGTTWEECLQNFQGEGMNEKKTGKLGNQWNKFYETKKKPLYTVLIFGLNSLDRFDREIAELDKHTNDRDGFWRRAKFEENAAYNQLCPVILNVFKTIKNHVPYSDMTFR